MKKDIHLNDSQYLELLDKIEETIKSGVELYVEDSTMIGNKYTESNVGLCNDGYTTLEMSLFPDEYPERRDKKYTKDYQLCPFDNRTEKIFKGEKCNLVNGCYYTCCLAKTRVSRTRLLTRLESLRDFMNHGELEKRVKKLNKYDGR